MHVSKTLLPEFSCYGGEMGDRTVSYGALEKNYTITTYVMFKLTEEGTIPQPADWTSAPVCRQMVPEFKIRLAMYAAT